MGTDDVELIPGTRVVVEGRWYFVELLRPSQDCTSACHSHPEPHSDGSDGRRPHHHHSERCEDLPLAAILRPEDGFAGMVEQDVLPPVYRKRKKAS